MSLRAGIEVVSHTEAAVFRRCPREHFYHYTLWRVPLIKALALQVGSRLDAKLKKIHGEGVLDLEGLEPQERALMQGYVAYWGMPDTLFECERAGVRFQVTISGAQVKGEFDAVGHVRETGHRAILECKSTSEDIAPGSLYWRRIQHLDPQPTVYLTAVKKMGWERGEILWDAIHKPQLRLKKKETPEEFEQRVLEDIAGRPTHYFQRHVIVRLEHEHATYMKDLAGTVRLMQVARQMGPDAPKNPDACVTKWGRQCDYFEVCEGGRDIFDNKYFGSPRQQAQANGTPEPAKPASTELQFEF
jgi:hypothetical protein